MAENGGTGWSPSNWVQFGIGFPTMSSSGTSICVSFRTMSLKETRSEWQHPTRAFVSQASRGGLAIACQSCCTGRVDVSKQFRTTGRASIHVRGTAETRGWIWGLSVQCEVLQCDEPNLLVFSWEAGELVGTQVSFKLERDGTGTRLLFEHSGFDVSQPFGKRARHGAEYGWSEMLNKLAKIVSGDEGKAT